jgi:hypothetical protein
MDRSPLDSGGETAGGAALSKGQRALEEEGVQFDARGRALPEYVLSVDDLRALYEAGL